MKRSRWERPTQRRRSTLKFKNIRLVAFAAVALAVMSVSAKASNLIVNGNFDDPSVGTGWSEFSSVTGWSPLNTSDPWIEIDYSPVLGLSCYTAGCQNLEVNANTYDLVGQTVTGLTVGQTYDLSWAYGDRASGGNEVMNVLFGGNLVTTDTGTGTSKWYPNNFTVTVTSTSESLIFATDGSSTGDVSYGNDITAVSLTQVPEPGALGLLGTGLLGLLGFAKRKFLS